MAEQHSNLAQRFLGLPGFSALVAMLIFACFPDVLLGRSSFYFRDYGVLGLPVVHHWRESILAGEFPLWNPLSNCGVPFFAQWGTLGAYPLSAILLLPLPWSLGFFCLFHLWLAAIGMYVLAQRWTANNVAAAIAGAVFAFNGVVFASLIWPNYFVAFAWMPFVVLLTERAWREGGRWVLGAALVSALQLGSGVPELIVFTWVIVGLLWIFDFGDDAGSGGRMFLRTLSVVALAAALMAVQLLPFFELLAHSQRDPGFAGSKWSLPGWAVANIVAPLLNCFETPQGQYFQFGQEFMSSVYLGAPAVLLAIVGAFTYRTLRTWALLLLAVLAVLLACGEHTPIFPAIQNAIPVLGIARYPVKFIFLAAFILPLLTAHAVRALHVEPRGTSKTLIVCSGLMLLLLAGLLWATRQGMLADMSAWPENFRQNATLSWKDAALNTGVRAAVFLGVMWGILASARGSRAALLGSVAAVGLLCLDARTHVPNQNPTLPADEFTGSSWDDAVGPRPRFGESRVFIAPAAEQFLLTVSSTNASRVWQAKRRALWSHLNLLEAAPKVNGSATLQIAAQAEFQKALYATNASPALLDFLGVAYVNSNRFEWTRRAGAMPLVSAGQRVTFADHAGAMQHLFAADFDPRAEVVLPAASRATVAATNEAKVAITQTSIAAHRIACAVDAPAESVLVIAQSHFPAWQATVDGKTVPLHRANAAFQAVTVPAGQHQVVVEYRDAMFRTGALISATALLLCPIFWVVLRRRRVA